ELFSKNCEAAIKAFAAARKTSLGKNKSFWLYEAVTYEDCLGDKKRASELFSEYERERLKEEELLEKL
ncbi:MAG: hypothetical protein ACOY0S_02780, partial [Patescibacteria group bacterium]